MKAKKSRSRTLAERAMDWWNVNYANVVARPYVEDAWLAGYRAGRRAAIRALPDALAAKDAEIARLGAVVERQPKTADGVPAHNGMKVWYPGDDDYGTVTFHVCDEGGYTAINKCYSTRAAALAAKEKT